MWPRLITQCSCNSSGPPREEDRRTLSRAATGWSFRTGNRTTKNLPHISTIEQKTGDDYGGESYSLCRSLDDLDDTTKLHPESQSPETSVFIHLLRNKII